MSETTYGRREPHILIVSTKVDIASDAVVRELNAQGSRVTRLNTEDFPFDSLLTARLQNGQDFSCSYQIDGVRLASLDDVTSIWYRRVRSPERPDEMVRGVYDFCLREARSTVLGTVLAHSATRVMSPPSKIWAAENKLFQLATALRVGLVIPGTVITNDPNEVRSAFERFGGRMIVKAVRSGFVDYGHEQRAVFTSRVLEEHLQEVDGARWSPAIYQPLLPKLCDVRVTVVGSMIFVAEIDSQSDPAAVVDWRHAENSALPHFRAQIPEHVADAIRRMFVELGLSFGAVDLVRTPDDGYIFLEVNPNGQWLWLDDRLNLGVSKAIARWLSGSLE